MSDHIENLKAWCHWKRKEVGVRPDDLDFVNAVEDTVSQVNNWKARHKELLRIVQLAVEERDRLREDNEKLRAALETIADNDAADGRPFAIARKALADTGRGNPDDSKPPL